MAADVGGTTPDVAAAVTAAVQAALDAAAALLTAEAGNTIGADWIGAVAAGITSAEGEVTGAATTVMSAAVSALQTAVSGNAFTSIGLAISQGIAVGIRSGSGAIISAARNAARQAYNAAKQELDIHSPSRKMQWIGEQGGEGMAVGFEKKGNRIAEAAKALSMKALTNAQTAHGSTPIDYSQLGEATAAAIRRENPGAIDYDKMGAAVAQANKESGVGKATMVMDKREVARTVEPDVSTETARRGSRTIAGRPGQLVIV